MQLALYRAERPEVFDDIIGQKQIVKILQNQIKNGSVSQAYLFTGTHGTGKTSTARILAKAVNCIGDDALAGRTDGTIPCGECENCRAIKEGRFVDVIELDAASNNGVDDLRAIIDLVKYPPTIGKYKVYIIDEVHMLTTAAENAFLKTLEEPPEYAIFILATTDPQKVRATIRSRCMQLNFKRVSEDELVEGMNKICAKKGIEVTRDALGTIASKADGSVRDALSILEQCMAAGDQYIDKALVLEYTGSAGEDFYLRLTDNIASGKLGDALCDIDDIIREGKDAKQVLKDWLEHYRNLMITKYVEKASRIISASEENIERIQQQAASIDIKEIERAIRLMSEYINLGRYSDRPRILLESLAVRLSSGDSEPAAAPTRRPAAAPVRREAAPERERPVARKPEQPEPKQEDDAPVMMFTAPVQDEADLEADLQLARATSPSGDAHSMWDRICAEISRKQPSFSIIAVNSQGKNHDGDEILVYVKKNKLAMAESFAGDIDRIAKALYGTRTYVKLIAGEVDNRHDYAAPVIGREEVMPEVPESEFVSDYPPEVLVEEELVEAQEEMAFDRLTSNLADSFGMNIEVVEE